MGTTEELEQRLDRAHIALVGQTRLTVQLQRIVDLKHALLEEGVLRSSYTKSMMIEV